MSVITTIASGPGLTESAKRVAYVTGEPLTKESWYRHKDTGVEYWHISAGIAHQTDQPGAVVIVGARRTEPIVMEAIGVSQGAT